MTPFALLAELALVRVIFLMTAVAVLGCGLQLRGGMALEAVRPLMTSDQLKVCLVMIEQGLCPVICRMTLPTLCPQDSFVLVIFSVTSNAGLGGRFKISARMTGLTLDFVMFSLQGKAGLGMIKADFGPRIGRVAVLTLFTQGPFVFIVLLMARKTVSGSLPILGFPVALYTPHLFVFSGQIKIGLPVIKTIGIKIDQVICTSFVFGMTNLAAERVNLPMKTSPSFNISLDLFMAGEALVKKLLLDQSMALQALSLVFLVHSGDLTRHDSFQKIEGLCDSPTGKD